MPDPTPQFETLALALAGLLALGACQAIDPHETTTRRSSSDERVRFTDAPSADGQTLLQIELDQRLDPQVAPAVREEIEALAERLSGQLTLPAVAAPVRLTLFADEPAYRRHVSERFPNFPVRRAIFAESSQRMEVIAQWGPHVAVDVRHEAVHAFLHASLEELPLWLDEGLAEYFETLPDSGALQAHHVETLRRGAAFVGWRPDLLRLESLTDPGALTELDYAEAWLWTWWLLSSPSESQIVRDYLAELAHSSSASRAMPLSGRLADALPELESQMRLWIEAR